MAIAQEDYTYICSQLRSKSGIVLEAGKEYLVEARLAPIVRREQLGSIEALAARMRASTLDPLHRQVIEALTTNETSFFRDHHPFEAFKNVVLPTLLASRAAGKSLSIWCGASSTGQEPYTIAMILRENMPQIEDWNLRFIATDISSEMIARSRAGAYNQLEVNRGLPALLLVKYFERHGVEWRIKEPLKRMIEFREMNLMLSWPDMPPMDVIFMRNVLIYFDTDAKREIFRRIRGLLKPDGYLFLGGAETTMGLDDGFERAPVDKGSCYRLKSTMAKVA